MLQKTQYVNIDHQEALMASKAIKAMADFHIFEIHIPKEEAAQNLNSEAKIYKYGFDFCILCQADFCYDNFIPSFSYKIKVILPSHEPFAEQLYSCGKRQKEKAVEPKFTARPV